MIENISVVIIAKNAQETISECLNTLRDFNEVILYLNNSSDNTRLIAKEYKNVKIVEGEFFGFGKTKNKAAQYATNDWILSLDSDEMLTKELFNEINSINLSLENVYKIKRDNFFLKKRIKYSGWGNDWLLRLYNKKYNNFNDNLVHEFVEINNSKVIKLKNTFHHNAVPDINVFLYKIIKYSDLGSENKKNCFFIVAILKGLWAFFKTYIIKLGFLDGWRGFVIAISNFNGKFFRYTKRYINCKKKK